MLQTSGAPCTRSFQTITKALRPCIICGVYKSFQVLTSLLFINNRNVKTCLFHVVSPILQLRKFFLFIFRTETPLLSGGFLCLWKPLWTEVIKSSFTKRMHCDFVGLSRTLHEALNLEQRFYAIHFNKVLLYFIDPQCNWCKNIKECCSFARIRFWELVSRDKRRKNVVVLDTTLQASRRVCTKKNVISCWMWCVDISFELIQLWRSFQFEKINY